jgi:hypothetical protein
MAACVASFSPSSEVKGNTLFLDEVKEADR